MAISAMDDTVKSGQGGSGGMERAANKNQVVREGLTEKTFQQRTKGGRRASYSDI